jgi:hypothetical protein
MAKETLEQKIDALTSIVEKGFAAVAEDISKLATKDQVFSLQTQVNSIETQLRDMQHTKLHARRHPPPRERHRRLANQAPCSRSPSVFTWGLVRSEQVFSGTAPSRRDVRLCYS